MSLKKIASLTSLLCFLIVLMTSVILYIMPQGRIAYWANWHLMGLSKDQWQTIHINIGLLMILSLTIHIYYNWRLIVSYLKKQRQLKIVTPEFNLALVLTLIWGVGSYAQIPPFSYIQTFNKSIKAAAAQKYGTPPYGHAELSSLASFCQRMGIDLNMAIEHLHQAGYEFATPSQTIQDLAERNRVSPQQIYFAILPTTSSSAFDKSSSITFRTERPTKGLGKLTLAQFCRINSLDSSQLIKQLHGIGIKAEKEMTIKHISDINQMGVAQVYSRMQTLMNTRQSHTETP